MADIKAGAAEDTFALVDFVGNADINAVFRAQQSAPTAGDTTVGNEIVLLIFHRNNLLIFLYHSTS